jgi:outer membrane protein assembly factor BamB
VDVIRVTPTGGPSMPGPGGIPGRRRRRLWGLGLVVGIGLPVPVLAGVGTGLYHAFFRVPEFRALLFEGGRVARGAVLPVADGAVVLGQENAQPVIDTVRSGARGAGQARVYLTRVDARAGEKPRWDVTLEGVTGPDAGLVRLWLDGDRVLVSFRERLEAYALDTGARHWGATMSDAVHAGCRQCLAAGGGRVAVLAADGIVQAFDAATGRALWRVETRLNRPLAPDLEVAAALVTLVDRGARPGDLEVLAIRADSGQILRRLRPACSGRSPWVDTTQLERDGGRMVLAVGRAGTAHCFEAWDLARGTLAWQTALPREGVRVDETRLPWYVVSGRALHVGQASVGAVGPGRVWTLALDTGRLRAVPVPEGFETRALDARDGVLLLRVSRQRGTARDELWAMEAERGTVLWQTPLGATGGPAPRWTARATPAGVELLLALERPSRLAYELLDPRTGRSLASVTGEVEAATWEGVAWTDDAAWLTIASPYRVDLRAGTLARVWPWQSLANCQNIGGRIVCTR